MVNKIPQLGLASFVKPLEELEFLENIIRCGNAVTFYSAGSSFMTNATSIYFLIKGVTALYKKDIPTMIGIVNAPVLLGLTNLARSKNVFNVSCETDCEFIIIDMDRFYEIAVENHAWEHIAKILCLYTTASMTLDCRVMHKKTYDIVRSLIVEYSELHQDIKDNLMLNVYIRKRSGMSRSHIMSILSVMARKQYIKIIRGKLLLINKLPDKL